MARGHYWVYPNTIKPQEIIFVLASEAEIEDANRRFPGIPHTYYPYHKTACDLSQAVFVEEI